MQPLLLMGAGSGATEVLELIRDINEQNPTFEVTGILDDDPEKHHMDIEGNTVLGALDLVSRHPQAALVFNMGSHKDRFARYRILDRLGVALERFTTLVHPGAKVYGSAQVGPGSIIHFGAIVGPDTRLEGINIIHWNAAIGARNLLGEGVIVSPNATTNADVTIGPYSFVGSASVITDGLTVGPGCLVASGDTVFRDVPPGAFRMGMPPRELSREDVPATVLECWNRR